MTDTTSNSKEGFKYTSIESDNPDGYDENTKYTRVEEPNELGYSKVSVRVGDDYKMAVRDASGKDIIPLQNILINSIDAQVAIVQQDRYFFFVDLKKQAADHNYMNTVKKYDFASPYSCGLALVIVDGEYFFIDENENQCFNEHYTFAESFFENSGLVFKDEKKLIIDTKGKIIATLKYDEVNPFSSYVWQVTRIKNDKYHFGFIDRHGKEVVPLNYDEIGYYDPESKRTRVRIGEKEGFLDEYGKIVIPVKYESTSIFDKGRALVILDNREFEIDINGNELQPE